MFPWKFLQIGNAHASGESRMVFQLCSTSLVFSGSPSLGYAVVFLLLRIIFRARVQRWVSFGQFPRRIFCVFCHRDRFFGLCEARHASFSHRGSTRSHICANLRHKTTNSAANRVTKSNSAPSVVGFRKTFYCFFVFSELCDFVKFEVLSGPELDFEGTGSLKI